MRRHGFTLRKPTSVAQKPPSDYEQQIVRFVVGIAALRKRHNFQLIYGADETGVWLNPTGGLCVEQVGRKDVSALGPGPMI